MRPPGLASAVPRLNWTGAGEPSGGPLGAPWPKTNGDDVAVGVTGADAPPGRPNEKVEGLAVPTLGAPAPNANAGCVAGDPGNPLETGWADPNALDAPELPVLKPVVFSAGGAAGKGLAGVGKALAEVGLG